MSDILELTTLDSIKNAIELFVGDVVVLFTAPSWCVPCQRLHPHWVKTAEQTSAVFIEVDIDNAGTEVSEHFGVMSVPTMKLFREGEFVKNLESRTVLKLVAEICS